MVVLLLKVEENTFKTNASRCAILVGLTNPSSILAPGGLKAAGTGVKFNQSIKLG